MSDTKSIQTYDLIVLGSGPAGEKGAAQAAYFGKKVALIEREYCLGGAAAGTTLPSKTLRETSLALSGVRARRLHGVDLSLKRQATAQDFLHHERSVKDAERSRVQQNMRVHKIDVFHGMGSFVDKRTIVVESKGKKPVYLQSNVILIATGSSPRHPDNIPSDPHIYDSDTILQIKQLPKSMVVIGGGVIGCEYACTFAALGVSVSLINNKEILLPFLDSDISLALEHCMRKQGITLLMPENVESCNPYSNGIKVRLQSGTEIKTDVVMLATGRTSNTKELNLPTAGITPGKYGLLVVDQKYHVVHPETKKPITGIYAAGDVIGPPALASTSMEQARYAMIQAFNLEPYKEHVAPILPLGIYTIPECSLAGKTEKECQDEKIDYVVGKAAYNQNARGMIIGDTDGFLKLIYAYSSDIRRPMKLLGVHAIGEIASELIHIGVTALIQQATSNVFIDTCYNYPTLGELYKYATYDAMGKRAKCIEQ
jgi:NAD(P) transhydrogenase